MEEDPAMAIVAKEAAEVRLNIGLSEGGPGFVGGASMKVEPEWEVKVEVKQG